jgi:hypothetical protein
MAFKYYQLAVFDKEDEHDGAFKVADFLYYGTAGYQDMKQSMSIYKLVQE